MTAPIDLHELLQRMVARRASDLHLTVGLPPTIRVNGSLTPLEDLRALTAEDTQQLCTLILNDTQCERFAAQQEIDLSFGVRGLCRFRANLFVQRGAVAGVFRAISPQVPSMEELGLPAIVGELSRRPSGLVLVTGPTGSGKSTTMAAMVDLINRESASHIITFEDPIEYYHSHKRSLVNQREIGLDTEDFRVALRAVLRQDPDVVLVGEMRDLETVEAAIRISETGHLCMATLHTHSAVQSINRLIDMFPPHQQQQVRAQLSFSLQGVMSQRLLPKADGTGRALALEVLVMNTAVRHMIREDKTHQIYGQMQMGQSKYGMQTMNQSLFQLYRRRQILLEDARGASNDLDEFTTMLVSQGQGRG
ncbi:MAG: type IV pilus twitching motility protein PilT [Myxococcota bacterium]|nr:type IV pilus twitching motility protein PilT [Myxococcota bacterium]